MNNWGGDDRRKPNIEDVMTMLHELKVTMESHIAEESALRPRLDELITLLERSKGIVWLFKGLVYIGAPVVAVVYWIKDHVRL